MLNDIMFSLDRVMPYFLLIVLGAALSRSGVIPVSFFKDANLFTFKIALPAALFFNLIDTEKPGASEGRFMLYTFVVTLLSFFMIWLVTELLYKDKRLIGTLVQGAFRGNFVLLGVPLVGSVLGEHAMRTAAMASIVLIPSYNALSVVVLAARSSAQDKPTFSGVLKDIITNPLIISIFLALPLMFLNAKIPLMLDTTFRYVGQTGTPLGLLSIGGMLSLKDATARLYPALYSSLIKNLLLPLSVMAASLALGFRGEQLLTLLVMSAAPVAISSYAMAVQMDGDGPLASNIVIFSTFLSGFTLAAGIYLLRAFSLV